MKRLTSLFLTLSMAVFAASSLTGQFDDLYFDGSESLVTPSEEYVYSDDNYDSQYYGDDEVYSSGDEYDEYIDYYTNDYEVDGYRYTNRIDRYRMAVFTANYYGVPYWGSGAGYDAFFLSRYANDPFFASYIRNQLIFGPSSIRLRSAYGYGPYGDPFSPFFGYNRGPGLYVGVGFGNGYGFNSYNRGYSGFGRGFGGAFGGGYYCPPYGGAVASNRLANFNNGNRRDVVNTTRRTGTRTTSSRINNNNNYDNASSIRSNTATSTRRSVRNTNNVRGTTASPRKSVTDRSRIGTSSSRRTSTRSGSILSNPRGSSRTNSRVGSSSRSNSRSYVPSSTRTSTRSSGATRSSTRSSSTRSSSTKSSTTRSSSRSSSSKRKTSPR